MSSVLKTLTDLTLQSRLAPNMMSDFHFDPLRSLRSSVQHPHSMFCPHPLLTAHSSSQAAYEILRAWRFAHSIYSVCVALPITMWCRYFAEAPAACNSMCDNCLRQLKVNRQDVSAAAAAVVETLQNLPAADKRLTLTQLVDAWRKSQVLPLPQLLCHTCMRCLHQTL